MTLAEQRRRRGEPPLPEEAGHDAGPRESAHPGPLEYIQIGAVLAMVTALEVALYYIDFGRTGLVAALIALSVFKFSLVVLWFMHLRFDNRIFSIFFVTGLAGAMVLFTFVLAMLGGQLV